MSGGYAAVLDQVHDRFFQTQQAHGVGHGGAVLSRARRDLLLRAHAATDIDATDDVRMSSTMSGSSDPGTCRVNPHPACASAVVSRCRALNVTDVGRRFEQPWKWNDARGVGTLADVVKRR